jgi:hypothetical protein
MTLTPSKSLLMYSALALAVVAFVHSTAHSEPANQTLKAPAEFQSIADPADRSRAIFLEVAKVITHPRCMNCHPAGDQPLQGDDQHNHMPPVWRAETGHFEANCSGCHTGKNTTLREAASYKSIPGHPRWGFAPLSMAWQNKSVGDICRQLKDVKLNGGRDLAALQEHIAKDDLVAGAGIPAKAVSLLPEVRKPQANWFKPG